MTREHLFAGAAFPDQGEGHILGRDRTQHVGNLSHRRRTHHRFNSYVNLSFLAIHVRQMWSEESFSAKEDSYRPRSVVRVCVHASRHQGRPWLAGFTQVPDHSARILRCPASNMDGERTVHELDCDWRTDETTNVGGRPDYPSAEQIAAALRRRMCPKDRAFDYHLPAELRVVSGQFWTPLAVALRTAEWIDDLAVQSVVDIGSGAGKFCVAAGLAARCRFIGIEHRPRLVAAARSLARAFEVDHRVTFVEGALGEIQTPPADVYYLYNPFGENLYGLDGHLDQKVELSEERYYRDIAAVESLLQRAPVGTHVVTYNGFGGNLPEGYCEVRTDYSLPSVLRLSRKLR